MGLLTKKIAASNVSFAGIVDYANSGEEERPISATVKVERHGQIGDKEPLPILGALGAARLLSMLRREAHYVAPFMALVEAIAEELNRDDLDAPAFAVRDCVLTDPELLTITAIGEGSLGEAALNSGVPVLVDVLHGPVERTTSVQLHEGRNGMPSIKFKFPMKSANALTTIGAWTATVDYLVTGWPREEMAAPIGAGLRGLLAIWEASGYSTELGIRDGMAIEALLTDVVATNTPD
jgi:hypothetical protein